MQPSTRQARRAAAPRILKGKRPKPRKGLARRPSPERARPPETQTRNAPIDAAPTGSTAVQPSLDEKSSLKPSMAIEKPVVPERPETSATDEAQPTNETLFTLWRLVSFRKSWQVLRFVHCTDHPQSNDASKQFHLRY